MDDVDEDVILELHPRLDERAGRRVLRAGQPATRPRSAGASDAMVRQKSSASPGHAHNLATAPVDPPRDDDRALAGREAVQNVAEERLREVVDRDPVPPGPAQDEGVVRRFCEGRVVAVVAEVDVRRSHPDREQRLGLLLRVVVPRRAEAHELREQAPVAAAGVPARPAEARQPLPLPAVERRRTATRVETREHPPRRRQQVRPRAAAAVEAYRVREPEGRAPHPLDLDRRRDAPPETPREEAVDAEAPRRLRHARPVVLIEARAASVRAPGPAGDDPRRVEVVVRETQGHVRVETLPLAPDVAGAPERHPERPPHGRRRRIRHAVSFVTILLPKIEDRGS